MLSEGVCGVRVSTTRRQIVKNIGRLLNMIKSTIKMVIFTRQPLQLNFGQGGIKKLMEDAESETTQVIQSLTTLGLCVEESYGGSGF